MVKIDKFDQYEYLEVTESGANTFTEEEYSLPMQLPTSKNQKGRILEITRIVALIDNPDLVANSETYLSVQLTSASKAALVNLDDNDLVWKWKRTVQCIQETAVGLQSEQFDNTIEEDMQNQNGEGILYPYDTIYLAAKGGNNSDAKTIGIRLYYRYVDVDAAEILQLINP